jgi:hypothetical protein
MGDLCRLIWCAAVGLLRSRAALQAEILVLRHQLNVLRRKSPKPVVLSNIDRVVFAGLCRLAPQSIGRTEDPQAGDGDPLAPRWFPRLLTLEITTARRPAKDTRGHSPAHSQDERRGAPRIHGELLKLGIDVGQTTVAKYMAKKRRPLSQGWKTFLRNHADAIASMDLFVVPTISFRLLYGLLILRHSRRELLWLGVTTEPNAEWIARQLTEACSWKEAPQYMIRDRDGAYGDAFIRRVLSENLIRLGIRIVRQNHRMIRADACSPALARNVHRRLV